MVDKTKTKVRESGAGPSVYEIHYKARKDFIQRQNTGKLLVKANESEYENENEREPRSITSTSTERQGKVVKSSGWESRPGKEVAAG